MHHRLHQSHSFSFWAHICKPGAWLVISSPLWGEGTRRHFIKKKKSGRCLCTTGSFLTFPFLMLCCNACIKEIARFSPLSHTYYIACRCLCSSRHPTKKKKGLHTRAAIAASLLVMVEPDATFLRSSTCCSWWTLLETLSFQTPRRVNTLTRAPCLREKKEKKKKRSWLWMVRVNLTLADGKVVVIRSLGDMFFFFCRRAR